MPIDAPGKVFGLPTWAVVVTLGAAGVVGYLIFFRNSGGGSSSGSGSTYSAQGLAVMQNPDESATMALQNQLLSQLAVNQQAGFDTLNGNLAELGSSVDSGFSSVGTSLNGISGQITSGQNADSAYYQSLMGSMSNWYAALYSQAATNANTLYNQASGQYQMLANQAQAGQAEAASYYGNLYNLGQATYGSVAAGNSNDQAYYAALLNAINSLPKAGSSSSGGGGGGGGAVHQYVVNLPGGGQMRVNASSPSAALGNSGGSSIDSQVH